VQLKTITYLYSAAILLYSLKVKIMSKPPKAVRELAPQGVHKAVCVEVIDLGTQVSANPKFQDAHKVSVGFEISGKRKKNGEPFVVAQRYTFSANKKSNLSKDLKAWLGIEDVAKYDLIDLLGEGALVTIKHTDGGEYANITNLGGLPSGTKVPAPVSELVSLFLDDTFDVDVFEALPDHFKEKIAVTDEYAEVAENRPAKKSAPKKKTAAKKKK
jgi:hypothetical protein